MSFFQVRTGKQRQSLSDHTLHSMGCNACPLKTSAAATKDMEPTGEPDADIYILGEAPGAEEDMLGEPFVGKSGRLLRQCLTAPARINNTVRTQPPGNRTPTSVETECCRPSVVRDIEETKPKVLVTLGNSALRWVLGNTAPGIMDMQGRKFPAMIGTHPVWVYPTVHPSAVLRRGGLDTLIGSCFKRDIARAQRDSRQAKPPVFLTEEELMNDIVIPGSDFDDVMSELDNFVDFARRKNKTLVGFDLETTSSETIHDRKFSPHGKGAEIVSLGLSVAGRSIAIPVCHSEVDYTGEQRKRLKERLIKLLTSDLAGMDLVAHNLPFDMEWLAVVLDNEILKLDNLECSMSQAYVLDCRTGLSLDNTFRRWFGIWLKDINPVDVKTIVSEPIENVLRYCAADAKACRMLFRLQERVLTRDDKLLTAYHEQVERARALVAVQVHGGLAVDQDTAKKKLEEFRSETKKVTKSIRKISEVKKYEADTGKTFNPGSTKQCADVLRGILDKDAENTRKNVLETSNHPLARQILRYRTMAKMSGTYITSFLEGGKYLWPGGVIRPRFHPMRTVTRRLSSSDPNGQNFPKREHEHLRDMFIAPKGSRLVSIDFSQMEVCVLAMASQDRNLIKAIRTKHDIHSDWRVRLEEETKGKWVGKGEPEGKQRHYSKNCFVFPSFYGAHWTSVARNLKTHESIIKLLQNELWGMFPQIRKWQKQVRRGYERDGYVELLTGFRSPGILSENQLYNYPIQGTASDIVVKALCRLCDYAFEHNQTRFIPVLNIHDDLTFVLPTDTLKDDLKVIVSIMREPVYSFMKAVPINVEISIGKRWGTMKEITYE